MAPAREVWPGQLGRSLTGDTHVADTKQDDAGKRELDARASARMVKNRPEDTIFQAPYTATPKDTDEKSPQQKAADTRAKNKRRSDRAEKQAEREAQAAAEAGHPANADESAESAFQRTWSCPQCGRGTTLGPDQQPPTIMRCEGCGRDIMGDQWLPPGVGHGEPTLQVPPGR